MGRRRLGVVLLVPEPVASEVRGLRRALADPVLDRVAPHVTLLAPVNVRDDDLGEAVAAVDRAAARSVPLHLHLGPVATFAPVSPTVHLAVAGPGRDALRALRAEVQVAPLARPDVHDYVPHVTLTPEAPDAVVRAALTALAGYRAEVVVDAVHLLEQQADRVWRPVHEAALAAPAPTGRGGFEVAVGVAGHAPPEGEALLPGRPVVAVAKVAGAVVGTARAAQVAGVLVLEGVVVVADHRGMGVGRRLLAALEAEAAERGCTGLTAPAAMGVAVGAALEAAGWHPGGGGWIRRLA